MKYPLTEVEFTETVKLVSSDIFSLIIPVTHYRSRKWVFHTASPTSKTEVGEAFINKAVLYAASVTGVSFLIFPKVEILFTADSIQLCEAFVDPQ